MKLGRQIDFSIRDESGKTVIKVDREKIKEFIFGSDETKSAVRKFINTYQSILQLTQPVTAARLTGAKKVQENKTESKEV